jgi:hypothetical protein
LEGVQNVNGDIDVFDDLVVKHPHTEEIGTVLECKSETFPKLVFILHPKTKVAKKNYKSF